MSSAPDRPPYDLEERTYQFAKRVRAFIKLLTKTIANVEDIKQVVRSSGSVAAIYIEANESLSRKDFLMRIKICRKEVSTMDAIDTWDNPELETGRQALVQESDELTRIFGKILRNSEDKL